MTGMMFDVLPFISGRLNRRKILKGLPSHIANGVNDEIKKILNGEYADKESVEKILEATITKNLDIDENACAFTNYVGITCDDFDACRECRKITGRIVKNYIKRTGNKKYLALLKKKGENKDDV